MRALDHFAYPLGIDPGVAEIAEQSDYDSYIRSLIVQVLLTAQGERINRPDFGCSIRRLVFAPMGTGLDSFLQSMIVEAMTRWLSYYVQTVSVSVASEAETLLVELEYVVLATGETRYLNMDVTP